MTKEEMLKRIEELEELIFQVEMVDRWQERERTLFKKYTDELKDIKQKLKELDEK